MRNAGLIAAGILIIMITMGASIVGQSGKRIIDIGPPPIGPYSTAVRAGGLIYVSGALATGDDGKIVGTTVAEQTTAILQRMAKTLEAAGSSMGHVAAVMIYLKNTADFAAMNEAYRTFWTNDVHAKIPEAFKLPGFPARLPPGTVPPGRI